MKIYKKKKTHAYYSLATFRPKKAKVQINGRLEAAHKIIMEISLLIMEKSWNNHGILILNFCGNPVNKPPLGSLVRFPAGAHFAVALSKSHLPSA